MSNKVILTKRTNPDIKLEVSEDELFTLANGGRINNGKTGIKGGREALLSTWLIDGEPITPERLRQNAVDSRESSWVDKITGHIPTLTDVGNLLATGAGKALGWVDNPFTEQIARVKRALQVVEPGSPEEQRLQAALKTLEMSSNDWSSYDVVAKNDDVSAAPALLQGVHHAAKTVGDNIDLFDVGTAFAPVGLVGKAAKAGSKIPKVGKPMAKVAGAAAKHPVLAEVGEQTGLEGLHGALTYKPEEDEYMLTNAAQQGLIAGGLQGAVSGIGGRRLRAVRNLPENKRIVEGLEGLRARGVDVPEPSPIGRAGKPALSPEELETLKEIELEKARRAIPTLANGEPVVVTNEQLTDAIEKTLDKMADQSTKIPQKDFEQFLPMMDEYGDEGISAWESNLRRNLPGADAMKDGWGLEDVLASVYSEPYRPGRIRGIGVAQSFDPTAYANREFGRTLLEELGLNPQVSSKAPFRPGQIVSESEPVYKYGSGKYKSKFEIPFVSRDIEEPLENVQDLGGLAGLNYVSNPLERAAERPLQRAISQTPVVKHIPRIYEAQTLPAWSRGDVAGAWERAKANLFLDELREGLEGLTDRYTE